MNQALVNIGLLLSMIPIVLMLKGNAYAYIIAIALPCIHYGWWINKAMNEESKEIWG